MRRSSGSLALPSGSSYCAIANLISELIRHARCTTMQVYDLAWSPTGEYIIAGSTDNCARIFSATDGTRLPLSSI